MPCIDTPAMLTRIFEISDVTQVTTSYGIRSHIICVMRSTAAAMRSTGLEYKMFDAQMWASHTDEI